MIAIGHLIGYAIGTIDLVKIFGTTLGDSQFKQLTLIAAVFFNVAVVITSWAVQERILVSSK
jgi:solute carrier family 45 protein 1/2/4